jgi:rare lipoprotein A
MTVYTLRLLIASSGLSMVLLTSGCATGRLPVAASAVTPFEKAKVGTEHVRASDRQFSKAAHESPSVPPGILDASAAPAWGQQFYLDDGPGDRPPAELDNIPDAVPRDEPLRPSTTRPYSVFGTEYAPMERVQSFRQSGMASWYGKRFHGKPTSSGEPYDMYAMTAAHPTLPIPSYARVTNVANGRSVVVRINDRGPFHPGRIIDVSYAAAHRLGYATRGSTEVVVESIQRGDDQMPVANAGAGGIAPITTRVGSGTLARIEQAAARGKSAPGKELLLQLGAFGSRETAEALKRSVAAELPELAPGLTVAESGGKWRVRLGPMYDRSAMDYARDVLREKMGIRSFAVKP